MNIRPSRQEEIVQERTHLMTLPRLRSSRKPDTKDVFKHKEKEAAIFRRYGKRVRIAVTYDIKNDSFKSMDDLTEYTLRFESDKGTNYAITEYLVNGATDKVIFAYPYNGKVFENTFQRFIDAEISLIDRISEE